MSQVQTVLERARAAGRPSLVSYVTAGIRADWTDLLAAMIEAGSDAVEIGLPFSDPMLDGPVIQQASGTAISRGANTTAILAELRQARPRAGRDGEVPLIAMSYANHAYYRGIAGTAASSPRPASAGRSSPTSRLGRPMSTWPPRPGPDATLMVTPATPVGQMRAIARRSRGFLYVMSVMATTGSTNERDDERRWALAARALVMAAGQFAAGLDNPPPVLIGFGIDTPARAAAAVRHADGVIVASALMRRVLDGADASDIARTVGDLRTAIDTAR